MSGRTQTKLEKTPVIAAYANVYNMSGTPVVFEHDGAFYFGLAEVNDPRCVRVSQTFYEAFCDEFGNQDVTYGGKFIAVQTSATLPSRTLEFTVLEPEHSVPGALRF